MAEINCPICNRPNDANAERCWFCQAELPKSNPSEASEPKEDWLDSFRNDSEPVGEENPNPPIENEISQTEVPDWLARIRLREQEERQKSSESKEEPVEEVSSDVPDWLHKIQKGDVPVQSNDKESVAEPSDSVPEREEPEEDWLKSLASWQPDQTSSTESIPSEEEAKNKEEINPVPLEPSDSDWLKSFMQQSGIETEPEQVPLANTTSDSEQPSQPYTEPSVEEPLAPDETPEPGEKKPKQTAILDEEADWLSDFKALNKEEDLASQVIPPNHKEPEPQPAFDDSALFTWMDKQQNQPDKTEITGMPEEGEKWQQTHPEANVEIPEGTTPESFEENPVEPNAETEEEPTEAESIEKAALPPWLQALRPARKEEKKNAGSASLERNPLADIEGALLQENIEQFYSRPQIYGENLSISENQKKRAQILQNMVEPSHWEDQENPVTFRPQSRIWQLIIALLLIAAVILPAYLKNIPIFYPSLYPAEVVQMFNGINGLTDTSPVLVAAEFDTGLYGEISLSSQAVLEHLMERNVPLVSLSTTPTGATLLQEILNKAELKEPAFDAVNNVINLGYLPGGSMGLQALAANPITAMPKDALLRSAWDLDILKNVRKLSDFSAVIVITENADTARFWIEQVQPVLGKVPIYIIISAQSAPLLQPYYDSKQISGYLAGLSSATIYEEMRSKFDIAHTSYPAYQIALLVVTVMIFIAGIVALVTPRHNPEKGK